MSKNKIYAPNIILNKILNNKYGETPDLNYLSTERYEEVDIISIDDYYKLSQNTDVIYSKDDNSDIVALLFINLGFCCAIKKSDFNKIENDTDMLLRQCPVEGFFNSIVTNSWDQNLSIAAYYAYAALDHLIMPDNKTKFISRFHLLPCDLIFNPGSGRRFPFKGPFNIVCPETGLQELALEYNRMEVDDGIITGHICNLKNFSVARKHTRISVDFINKGYIDTYGHELVVPSSLPEQLIQVNSERDFWYRDYAEVAIYKSRVFYTSQDICHYLQTLIKLSIELEIKNKDWFIGGDIQNSSTDDNTLSKNDCINIKKLYHNPYISKKLDRIYKDSCNIMNEGKLLFMFSIATNEHSFNIGSLIGSNLLPYTIDKKDRNNIFYITDLVKDYVTSGKAINIVNNNLYGSSTYIIPENLINACSKIKFKLNMNEPRLPLLVISNNHSTYKLLIHNQDNLETILRGFSKILSEEDIAAMILEYTLKEEHNHL